MAKTVVIVGALDTKAAELRFVRELIQKAGVGTLVVDFGGMGEPAFTPDLARDEVAAATGGDLDYLAAGDHKDEAMVICHGGPLDEPENVTFALAKMPGIDGFFGASSIERLPTERAITAQVKAFKSSSLAAR